MYHDSDKSPLLLAAKQRAEMESKRKAVLAEQAWFDCKMWSSLALTLMAVVAVLVKVVPVGMGLLRDWLHTR